MCLSNREDWNVTNEWLQDQGTEGREAIRSAMRELEENGYAVHTVERQIYGVWCFYDIPVSAQERSAFTQRRAGMCNTDYGFPYDGNPSDGNPSTKKEQESEENQEENKAELASVFIPVQPAGFKAVKIHPISPDAVQPFARKPSTKEPEPILPKLPPSLTPILQDWEDWVADRKERKKPLTSRAAKRHIKMLEEMGAEVGRATINKAIQAGWTDLYPVKPELSGKSVDAYGKSIKLV